MNPNMMIPSNPGGLLASLLVRLHRFAGTAVPTMLLASGAQARSWTNSDGSKTIADLLKDNQ